MPRYEYECSCGALTERICSVKDHRPRIECECGRMAVQVLGFAHVVPDIEPYRSVVTGERIRGRSHHRAHLRDHGLIELGNEPIRERKPKPLPPVAEDIKRAIQETRSR
jgi:hypothetical protein